MQPPRRLQPHAGRKFTSHSVQASAVLMASSRWQKACLLTSRAILRLVAAFVSLSREDILHVQVTIVQLSLHGRSEQKWRSYHSRHLQLPCSKPSTRRHSKQFCLPNHLSHPRFQSFAPIPCAHMPYHTTNPPSQLFLPLLYTFILTEDAVTTAAQERMAFLDLRQSWLRMQHHMS